MTSERNRAMRIAYARARAGDEATARRWVDVAGSFAAVTSAQLDRLERLVREAGPFIHPGQLRIEER